MWGRSSHLLRANSTHTYAPRRPLIHLPNCSFAQENAEHLQEEGRILAAVQGQEGVDYDIGAYASKLRHILERKLATTKGLLKRLATFQRHLAIEEEVSKKVDASTLRQSIIG